MDSANEEIANDDLDTRDVHEVKLSKWNNLFRIELILFVYFCADFPLSICAQRYVLAWIRNQVTPGHIPVNLTLFEPYPINPMLTYVSQQQMSFKSISNDNFYKALNENVSLCIYNKSSHDYIIQQTIQKYSSEFLILRALCWTLPSALFVLCIGPISDAKGRHITILPPLIGQMVVCLTLVLTLVLNLPIYVLLAGDFIGGCGGSYPCLIMGAVAYTIDQCNGKKLLVRITLLQLCILVASSVSPFGSGWLIDHFGNLPIILSTLILSTTSIIYTITLMSRIPPVCQFLSDCHPTYINAIKYQIKTSLGLLFGSDEKPDSEIIAKNENQPREYGSIPNYINEKASSQSNDSDVLANDENRLHIKNISSNNSNIYIDNDVLSEHLQPLIVKSRKSNSLKTRLKIMFICYFLAIIPTYDASMLSLFMMGLPLCWSPTTIGIYFGLSMGLAGGGSFIIAAIIQNRIDNVLIAAFSSATFAVLRLYMYFVRNTIMMFSGLSVVMFLALLIPSLKVTMSQMVKQKEQGSLFGLLACVDVIGFLISSIVFNGVYSQTLIYSSNFFFLISASFLTLSFVFLLTYRCVFGRSNLLTNVETIPEKRIISTYERSI